MRSPRISKPDSVPMKFMPSRLCSSWPRSATNTGTRLREMVPTLTVSAMTTAAVALPLAVEIGTLKLSFDVSKPAASASADGQHRARRAGVDDEVDAHGVDRAARPEMAVGELFEHHRVAAVIDGQRAAGNEADGDAVGEILQFVAVLVAGDEHQDDQHPHGQGCAPCRRRRRPEARMPTASTVPQTPR